ncbi:N-acetyltransferase 16, like isoform X1 [Ictalurus punctatus]|uniref:N-acetyltransferase 16, like isoform X1 n=1 Tax=Ictalurus punctatus TaxID=7998 RepID=A0A9F7R1Z9_ICTPU|nr:N-acetyltransferase 16, like isoform X1 [Ictalurus punctatus]
MESLPRKNAGISTRVPDWFQTDLLPSSDAMEAQFVGESDGLTFWLARPQDYDEVMAISQDIYNGNDYLPHRYPTWMTEHDRVVIIGRRNGKLVALDSALVVDGGQTVVLEGLRVCPSERGCGVAGVIQRVTDCYVKQVYPSVTTKRLTRADNPGPENLSKFIFLSCQAILSVFGEAESFKRFISGLKAKLESTEKSDGHSNNNQKLFVLKDRHQLKSILMEPDLSLRLQLPGGAIIQDWQPLKPIESNLEILERRNLTWMVDCFDDKPMFMSLHTPPYPVPFNAGSLRFNIDMFGTDASLARRALIAHLEQIIEKIHGTVLVHVYMPKTFWEVMRQFCEGDEGVKQWEIFQEQLFLEKEMS